MFANIFIKNRPFFGRMRNGNYQKAHAVFRRLQELSRAEPFQPKLKPIELRLKPLKTGKK